MALDFIAVSFSFSAALERNFIVRDGKFCLQVPRNLRPSAKKVCLCICVSMFDGSVNSNRKWPVIHALTPALSPSCWSGRAHKQPHTYTHTYTAGLPVSGDLGWALEALHGFHIHSSPPFLPSELAPNSSFSSLPSHLFLLFHISYFFLSLSRKAPSDESIKLQPIGVFAFHLSWPFQDSDVRVHDANINE